MKEIYEEYMKYKYLPLTFIKASLRTLPHLLWLLRVPQPRYGPVQRGPH